MPEKSSRRSHYTAAVPVRGMGHLGPLAMLQSLMPSICLNGFLNPGPPFDSSQRQAVFRLLSLPVINPFISERSDQCCLEWGLPCQRNAVGKNREFWHSVLEDGTGIKTEIISTNVNIGSSQLIPNCINRSGNVDSKKPQKIIMRVEQILQNHTVSRSHFHCITFHS